MKPPRLLAGLFLWIISIIAAVLGISWVIINYQVEQLVATRTSEYAHSIAQIAANSSAEALLGEDKIQLKMLVENVAKDPYIRSATIFAEDGQVVVKHPEPLKLMTPAVQSPTIEETSVAAQSAPITADEESTSGQTNAALSTALDSTAAAYIQSQNDIPFIEKITYQGVTAGWFKVSLNRELLESSFRQSLQQSKNIILVIAALLLAFLTFLLTRYNQRVKKVLASCHQLIRVNAPQMPTNNTQWLNALNELSEIRNQALVEHPQLPAELSIWQTSRRVSATLFCYCQFAMIEQEDENSAECLSLAERYLKAAVQTHGVQSQGDILSGCLIPFLDSPDEEEAITEIFALVHLIAGLLESLPLKITMRAFIGKGTVLVLENERSVITGVSLSNRLLDKISQLAPITKFGDILSLGLEADTLSAFGQFEPVDCEELVPNSQVLQLTQINERVKQQINRQINFIITDN